MIGFIELYPVYALRGKISIAHPEERAALGSDPSAEASG
jgi:hypothetical protein